jgi:hypothetical protein
MTITISNDKGFEDDFFDWLIPNIREYVLAHIDEKKLLKVDEYINTNKYFHSIFKKEISSKEVIVSAMYNLKKDVYWDRVVISIDPNVMLPNTTVKLITVIKTINFGTLSIMGHNLITKNFKFIEDNIDTFYEKYLRGM